MLHDITRGDHFKVLQKLEWTQYKKTKCNYIKLFSMSDTDYNTNGISVLEKFNMYWAAVENI